MRTRLSASFMFATLGFLLAPAMAQAPNQFPNLVAAGDVGTDSAVLWTKVTSCGPVLFQVAQTATFQGPQRFTFDFVLDASKPAKAVVDCLQPGTRYYYRALHAGRFSPRGTFVTANAPGHKHGLRFGVSGDWRGELSPYPAVTNAGSNLAFFVELGDTIYADVPSPAVPAPQAQTLAEFRAKHSEVYSARFGLNALGDLRRNTAVFALIDDHEVTNDFAGGAAPATDPRFLPSTAPFINETQLYRNGLRAFVDANPIATKAWRNTGDARLDGKPQLYRASRFGDDAALFLLDARSFRDTGLPPVTNPSDPNQVFGFLAASWNPTRTMLGQAQLTRLQQDLLAAHQAGVTWKFVCVPEPIQNLGVVGASDRFEGYAAERAALLGFITSHGIDNVVFVAADLHGTLVNNVTWQAGPGQPQMQTGALEVITGAVAYDAPLGPTLVEIAAALGLLSSSEVAFYNSLPTVGRDAFLGTFIDAALAPFGYDLLGLQGSPILATLLAGNYVAAHTYGWTEFAIDAATQALTVTTYGIAPYTEADLAVPANVLSRVPQVVQQFVVQPQ